MGYSSVKADSKECRLPILSPWGEKFTVSHVEATTSITNVIRRVNSEHTSRLLDPAAALGEQMRPCGQVVSRRSGGEGGTRTATKLCGVPRRGSHRGCVRRARLTRASIRFDSLVIHRRHTSVIFRPNSARSRVAGLSFLRIANAGGRGTNCRQPARAMLTFYVRGADIVGHFTQVSFFTLRYYS
jgi:hypothetical protein